MVECLAQGQACKFLPRRNEVSVQGNPQVEALALGPFSCPSPGAAVWQGGGRLCCLPHPCLLPMGEGQVVFNEKELELGPQRGKEPPPSFSISMDEAGTLTQGILSTPP